MFSMPDAPAGGGTSPRPARIPARAAGAPTRALRGTLRFLALATLSATDLHGQGVQPGRPTLQASAAAAVPFSGLADAVNPGFTLAGRAALPLTPALGVYGGYSLTRFNFKEGGGRVGITGPEAGITVRLHTFVPVDVSLGGAYYDSGTSGLATNVSCNAALAGQVGLATQLEVADRVGVTIGSDFVLGFDPDHPCGTGPRPWPWPRSGGWGRFGGGFVYRF